ncbi:MAG: MoxR-like ATPase [Cellvibrionaceae bacterium]
MMKVNIGYPSAETEQIILQLARAEAQELAETDIVPLSQDALVAARQKVLQVYTAETLDNYIVQLTMATRQPQLISPQLAQWIDYGVSPRATIALDRCAKAHAFLNGQDFVTPDDIHAVIYDVFRHRLILSFEAEAQGITTDQVIEALVDQTAVS